MELIWECDVVPVDKIPYIDHPELRLNKHESTEMPFRYVKGEDGGVVMPEVSIPSRFFCELRCLVYVCLLTRFV